jgi:hypothetical protein
MDSATDKRPRPQREVSIVQNYDVAADSKNRISLRGAQTKYFQVKALSNGCYVLEPRLLVSPEEVPARTLKALKRSSEKLKMGKGSAAVALPEVPPGESFFDVALPILKQAWARRGRGLPDLASNPKYMEGFGE